VVDSEADLLAHSLEAVVEEKREGPLVMKGRRAVGKEDGEVGVGAHNPDRDGGALARAPNLNVAQELGAGEEADTRGFPRWPPSQPKAFAEMPLPVENVRVSPPEQAQIDKLLRAKPVLSR